MNQQDRAHLIPVAHDRIPWMELVLDRIRGQVIGNPGMWQKSVFLEAWVHRC